MSDEPPRRPALEILADVAGLEIPEEDFQFLQVAFENYVLAARMLMLAPASDLDSVVVFDARWT